MPINKRALENDVSKTINLFRLIIINLSSYLPNPFEAYEITKTTFQAKPPGSGPDLELKKAFMELQSKMVDTKQKLKMADLQIENLKRTITHSGISVFNTPSIIQIPLISFCIRFSIVSISGLTEHEIGTLPDETRVYESVGRMFILSDKPTVTTRLTEKQSTCQEKVIFNQLQYMLDIVSEIYTRTHPI